jgi:HSP20 family protein
VIGSTGGDGTWIPSADVVETDDAYVIEIELPGVRREDVDVKLNGNELVVTGELKERKARASFAAVPGGVVSSTTASRCRATLRQTK